MNSLPSITGLHCREQSYTFGFDSALPCILSTTAKWMWYFKSQWQNCWREFMQLKSIWNVLEGKGHSCFRQNCFKSLTFSYKCHLLSHWIPKSITVYTCVCPSCLSKVTCVWHGRLTIAFAWHLLGSFWLAIANWFLDRSLGVNSCYGMVLLIQNFVYFSGAHWFFFLISDILGLESVFLLE